MNVHKIDVGPMWNTGFRRVLTAVIPHQIYSQSLPLSDLAYYVKDDCCFMDDYIILCTLRAGLPEFVLTCCELQLNMILMTETVKNAVWR